MAVVILFPEIGFYRLVMHKSYQNFWLAKAQEIKYIPWGVYCMLHRISHFMAPQQLNNINIDCVIDCIPKYPTHINKNEKMSQYSLFSV